MKILSMKANEKYNWNTKKSLNHSPKNPMFWFIASVEALKIDIKVLSEQNVSTSFLFFLYLQMKQQNECKNFQLIHGNGQQRSQI